MATISGAIPYRPATCNSFSSLPEPQPPSESILNALPTELLCNVITFLDPIGLISLSQTSQSLRRLISPTRANFHQRLLALELLPSHGGAAPPFHLSLHSDTTATGTAPWEEPAHWRGARYVCASCLRLRHHLHFANHSLLGLGFRKPPSGAHEAVRCTDWAPLGGKLKRARREAERADIEEATRQYRMAASGRWPQEPGEVGDQWSQILPPPSIATREEGERRGERVLCGRERHRRMCNACRWERGEWQRAFALPRWGARGWDNRGTAEVPIVKSRRLRFVGLLDRFFPGLFDDLAGTLLEPEGWPPVFRIGLRGSKQLHRRLYSLYMARCPRCGEWRELAAFRLFLWRNQKPLDMIRWEGTEEIMMERVGKLKCNRCLAEEEGGKDEIVRAVLQNLEMWIGVENSNLGVGWNHLAPQFRVLLKRERHQARDRKWAGLAEGPGFEVTTDRQDDPPYLTRPFLAVVQGLPWKKADWAGRVLDLEGWSPSDLRRRVQLFRRLLVEEKVSPPEPSAVFVDWFGLWLREYEKIEAYRNWLRAAADRIRREPSVLLDYVLGHELGIDINCM